MTHPRVLTTSLVLLSLVFSTGSVTALQGAPSRLRDSLASTAQSALGTAFTYQGRLLNNGGPANGLYDLQFTLFDAAALGNQVGSAQVKSAVAVDQGLFTVALDFGTQAFNGDARWLEVAVRPTASSGTFTPLVPRQALTPAPYALALPGLYTVQTGGAANLIGGYSGNTVSSAAVGGTISGGGGPGNGCGGPCTNRVTENYATIGGGFANQAGNGNGSATDAAFATVAGGTGNNASADSATVSGGSTNQATGHYATVGGGWNNAASGYAATAAGGNDNVAQGNDSFAAGFRAHANHDGAFVWADTTNADFASTGNNQFLVRASGGVGINTASPTVALDVTGTSSGTLRVSTATVPGTIIAAIQAGTAALGTGVSGVNVFTVTFPSPFSAIPKVIFSPRNEASQSNADDVYAVTSRQVTTSYFVVNVLRLDASGGWVQNLQLDWFAAQ